MTPVADQSDPTHSTDNQTIREHSSRSMKLAALALA